MPPKRPERKEAIRRAAAELFALNGYHGTGVSEIGDAVGLGRGALYHHIGSKEQLLFEISTVYVDEQLVIGEAILASEQPADEKVRALSKALMTTIAEHKNEWTVFFAEASALDGTRKAEVLSRRRAYEDLWIRVLEEGEATGLFRRQDRITIKGVVGLHNYSYLWLEPEGRLSPTKISETFCDMFLLVWNRR